MKIILPVALGLVLVLKTVSTTKMLVLHVQHVSASKYKVPMQCSFLPVSSFNPSDCIIIPMFCVVPCPQLISLLKQAYFINHSHNYYVLVCYVINSEDCDLVTSRLLQVVYSSLLHSIGCHDGDLRLVGGMNITEGRLEFCYGGVWGTVCCDQWGQLDVRVACRQLGFSTSGKFIKHQLAFYFAKLLSRRICYFECHCCWVWCPLDQFLLMRHDVLEMRLVWLTADTTELEH